MGDTVYWDPLVTLNVVQADGSVAARSPAMGLMHELLHWLQGGVATGDYIEWLTLQYETEVAISLGEPIRPSYDSLYIGNPRTIVNNPTSHTKGGYWKALDPNGEEVKTAQALDPDAPAVNVIGTEPPASGGGSGGAGPGPSDSGGSPPTPSDPPPKTPIVIIKPAALPVDDVPVMLIGVPEFII